MEATEHLIDFDQKTCWAAYDELIDLFADLAVADRILAFYPSPVMQARVETLLEKNRQGTLTAEEQAELDEVERLEHLMRLIKARVRQKLAR